ncbi:MAG: GtrA family protein [Lentimicrobium sp.]|nr:GtrA family protein [Lentimicrobium sp.]MDD2527537.1 GtrA family protein [Lentimicrobiaceae bacterium]MDD4596697.1 GtrA family protein [Lentimicrobiaceae bacterium]MDY0024930.1 GtrA family protein [Lentimicrobium sp.]
MPSNLTSFIRYNIVAGLATATDFLVLVLLTEVFQLWYMFSGIMGALSGGIVSFIIERNWAFRKRSGNIYLQSLKYSAVWVTSILLNITGLFLLVEYFHIHYILSKVIVAVVVGMGFNFLTHRYFIFK